MLQAVTYVQSLTGTSLPHLMQCDDGNYYVVKLNKNPQGSRALANEMICCWLAGRLGIPVPCSQVIYIHDSLRKQYLELGYDLGHGPHYGSQFIFDSTSYPSQSELANCSNIGQAADIIAFDYWLDNNDRYLRRDNGQNILVSRTPTPKLWMIDNANIFAGPNWTIQSMFKSVSVHPMFWGELYAMFVPFLDGPDPFGRAIANITALSTGEMIEVMAVMPAEWGVSHEEIAAVSHALEVRKNYLPYWISHLQDHFPMWRSQHRGW